MLCSPALHSHVGRVQDTHSHASATGQPAHQPGGRHEVGRCRILACSIQLPLQLLNLLQVLLSLLLQLVLPLPQLRVEVINLALQTTDGLVGGAQVLPQLLGLHQGLA